MRFRTLILVLGFLVAALPGRAEVIELAASGTSAASTDSGEIDADAYDFSLELCGGTSGNVFSGSISILQGNKSGKMVESWNSGAISSQSGCSAATFAFRLPPTALVQVVITRSGGTYGAWLYRRAAR